MSGCDPSRGAGTLWTSLYVDGQSRSISWSSVPVDEWIHFHLEAGAQFTDNINLMSRMNDGSPTVLDGLKGTIALKSRTLSSFTLPHAC